MKQYGTLYIDAPWHQETWSAKGEGRSAKNHYPVMSLDDLKALPVQNLMAPDCAVFMWTTGPHLEQAFALAAAWGLRYSTIGFMWAKINRRKAGRATFMPIEDHSNWFMGMGYWTRSNVEPCLLFVKGSPKRKSRAVRQLVASPIRRHSQKPDRIYSDIESLVDGPYLEIFARQMRPKWDCWGNEVISTVDMFPMLPSGMELAG